jgi:hypothetical protein
MDAVRSELQRAIEWLEDSSVAIERHYQAAILIRVAALDFESRKVAQDLDVVKALVPMLDYGAEHPVTIVAVEGLACLVADHPKCRVRTSSCCCFTGALSSTVSAVSASTASQAFSNRRKKHS